ncbi:MAG: sodium:solute symporter family protein [Balneolaceae bacterium]
MHPIDLSIFVIYIIGLLAFGIFFFRKNESGDDYFVGGRNMKSFHVGLSVVATDVGGGFSIGLGGLGFVMGLSGSWMLFTGLLGAWLAAVFLIPKIKENRAFDTAYTFPQIFEHYYSANVALIAAVISAIGYAGFTSSQMLAGAKLANGTFADLELTTALYLMGTVAIVYTVLGGLKAVIYTDTIQWALLMAGLILIGIPISYVEIGGIEAIRATVAPEMLSLTNVSWQDIVYWAVTIIPIWFVGMTLYQRIYACHDEQTAKKAWYLAGVFEWPLMAFLGVSLGLFARVAAEQGMFAYLGSPDIMTTDPETGLPMLLRTVLPVGFLGIMMAAYFSAILSTADSCLMASSGNVVTDIIGRFSKHDPQGKQFVRLSQVVTLIIGALAMILAANMSNVLDLMLDSYAFMVSGLFVPVIGALYWKKSTSSGAIAAMILGGVTTLSLRYLSIGLPYSLDPNVFGITASAVAFIIISLMTYKKSEI